MKQLKNKSFKDRHSKKVFNHHQKRKDKHYLGHTFTDSANPFDSPPLKKHRLPTPKEFSFIYNLEESLDFFKDFIYYMNNVDLLFIDMRKTESMTIEVLLYLISLHKISVNNNIKVSIEIKTPNEKNLIILMAQSGFSKYFKSNVSITLNHDAIFTIRDGSTNRKQNKDDAETCKEAVDFAMKKLNKEKKDPLMRKLFTALAEMMLNTDNHAYDEDGELRNWYLFAVENTDGIDFYFFDNGKGITKTAKKSLLEKTVGTLKLSLAQPSIMKAVLNGEYRSATGLRNRNKGIPQINELLIHNNVKSSIILTNKILFTPQEMKFEKSSINFKGTLYVWKLKKEQNEN